MYYKSVQVLLNFQEKRFILVCTFENLCNYVLKNCFILNFKWCQLSVHESSFQLIRPINFQKSTNLTIIHMYSSFVHELHFMKLHERFIKVPESMNFISQGLFDQNDIKVKGQGQAICILNLLAFF